MFRNLFANVRAKSPLVHNITNYVTVNDCANIVLACGASPIMADDAAEVEDITSLCAGLNLNIGTLNSRTIPSMLLAGHTANRLGRPVVLDPVGAGASHLRTETALRLLREVKFTVIRGNISEIRTLAAGSGTTKGVDADTADKVTDETLDKTVAFAKAFAARTGAVVAVTGAIDIVAVFQTGKPACERIRHHLHRRPKSRWDEAPVGAEGLRPCFCGVRLHPGMGGQQHWLHCRKNRQVGALQQGLPRVWDY